MNLINPRFPSIWHGGDYNPEQWPRETWTEDIRLMKEAGVNVATLGVFSWVSLESEEGRYTFDWLDEIIDLLWSNGIHFVLATPSAAPPAWLTKKYPETLRVGPDRVRRLHGNRVNYNYSSPVYIQKSVEMAAKLAERYGNHPGLAMWHVSNEYGGEDYSEDSHRALIEWLKVRYEGDLGRLNAAYWSAFWGHTYTEWEQIPMPGVPYSESSIHGLTLDWKRFVSHQTLQFFLAESAPLREKTPEIPITTNMMGFYETLDYWKWAPHVDVFAWDSYPGFVEQPIGVEEWVQTAFVHDMFRSFKQKPFMLMEFTPSSSNWYSAMRLKRPGHHRLEAIQAVAHGSDAVMYFQWRQSRGSQEKWHGAVVSHGGGTETRVFQDVAQVGRDLPSLESVLGKVNPTELAIIVDWENRWALRDSVGPVPGEKNAIEVARAHYRPFWERSVPVSVIDSEQPFDGYRLLIAPMLYMLKPGVAERLERFVAEGGVLVTTYLTGLVDESDLVFQRYESWPLQALLGYVPEETDALFAGESVPVTVRLGGETQTFSVSKFADLVWPRGAEVFGEYDGEFYAGKPFLTRNAFGKGFAYGIQARADQAFTDAFLGSLVQDLGLYRVLSEDTPAGVTATRRGQTRFILNHNESPVWVSVDGEAVELPAYGWIAKP